MGIVENVTSSPNLFLYGVSQTKIRRMKINWQQGLANGPRIQVLVDKIPKREELNFMRKGNLYLAIKEGYAQYFSWSGTKNDGGFYGAIWHVIVEGKPTDVLGPWSARAGFINRHFETQIIDVQMTDDPVHFEKDQFVLGGITLELVKEGLEWCSEAPLLVKIEEENGDIIYQPIKGLSNPASVQLA